MEKKEKKQIEEEEVQIDQQACRDCHSYRMQLIAINTIPKEFVLQLLCLDCGLHQKKILPRTFNIEIIEEIEK